MSAVVNGRSLGVQYHAPQCARGRILPPSHGSRKNELKEEYRTHLQYVRLFLVGGLWLFASGLPATTDHRPTTIRYQ
jgi:hypothetical protein